jgi:hypothetical protein
MTESILITNAVYITYIYYGSQIVVLFLLYEFSFWYWNPEKASYFYFDCKFSSADGYLIGACGGLG